MGTRDTLAETAQRPMDRPAERPALPARLYILHPPALCQSVGLGDERVVFGRKPDEPRSVRLNDATVSRQHFAIEWVGPAERHVGKDLGSRNGSRVSGQLASANAIPLEDGAVVRIGDVVGIYERHPGLEAAPAPGVSPDAVPGDAASIRLLRAALARAAADPSPVLIVGETGTGKEYVAREIHRLSGRRGPFIAINCAALSPQLIESQLFGHAKGAFTGALTAHDGLFRAANGGTLFLDEIGELPREMQPKLLRVLQEHEVLPVGETRAVKVDARVVAATLRDLARAVESGEFRLDLYARISPWELRVPALRERRADLLAWLTRLHAEWRSQRNLPAAEPPTFSADAIERLLLHEWTDNLRGLERLVHRLAGEPSGAAIDTGKLDQWLERPRPRGAEVDTEASDDKTGTLKVPKPSKEELARVLEQQGGSIRATAKHFGRDRRQIYRWMEQYGLRGSDD